ncbi:MAG: hypothetical protein QM770_22195 [Tepidisphaeraceae bacterium]
MVYQGLLSNEWTNGSAWSGFVAPTSLDMAWFDNTVPVVFPSVNLSANRTVATWYVRGDSVGSPYTFTRSGSVGLTVTSDAIFGFSSPSLSGGTPTLSNFTFSAGAVGVLGNTALRLYSGSSATVSSTWSSANTATTLLDSSTVSANKLVLQDDSKLQVGNASTLTLTNGMQIGSTGTDAALEIANGGTLTVTGNITVPAGTLQLQSTGTLNVSSGATIGVSSSVSDFIVNRNWAIPSGVILNVTAGADVFGSSYIDIGNGGTGTLTLDGTGTTYNNTGATPADWGATATGNFTGTLSNSAQANVVNLRMGTTNATASLQLLSSATLAVSGNFTMGGGSNVRTVGMDITGGTLQVIGNTTLDTRADINLNSGGIVFTSDSTINANARIDWLGGTLTTTNAWLTLNGGTIARGPSVSTQLSNGSTLRILAGGQFTGVGYYDMANSNTTGGLLVSGAGSTFTAGGLSDWGRNASHTATATIESSGQATVNSLNVGTNDAAATVAVNSGGKLAVGGNFTAGGGSASRTVAVNVAGGTLEVTGNANFFNGAALTLSSGAVDFKNGATFNAGSTLTWTGGALSIGSGKVLNINNTYVSRAGLFGSFSAGATLSITGGGAFATDNYMDIPNGSLAVNGTGSVYWTSAGVITDWGGGSAPTRPSNSSVAAKPIS